MARCRRWTFRGARRKQRGLRCSLPYAPAYMSCCVPDPAVGRCWMTMGRGSSPHSPDARTCIPLVLPTPTTTAPRLPCRYAVMGLSRATCRHHPSLLTSATARFCWRDPARTRVRCRRLRSGIWLDAMAERRVIFPLT